jgi:hypothetical protein
MKSILLVLIASTGIAFAQAPAEKAAPDGAKPSDGAIKGGSIVPGETAGTPDGRGATPAPSARGVQRCNELSGTLREQCLEQERNAGMKGGAEAGATVPASPAPGEPPPQNPR